MGESTAESGPRCGEAEEAKRRPAMSLGLRESTLSDAFGGRAWLARAPFPIDP